MYENTGKLVHTDSKINKLIQNSGANDNITFRKLNAIINHNMENNQFHNDSWHMYTPIALFTEMLYNIPNLENGTTLVIYNAEAISVLHFVYKVPLENITLACINNDQVKYADSLFNGKIKTVLLTIDMVVDKELNLKEVFGMKFNNSIGNPPYTDGTAGKGNIWDKFIEKVVEISDNTAMIVPSSIAISNNAGNGSSRKLILDNGLTLFKFLPWDTFKDATVSTCYFITEKNNSKKPKIIDVYNESYIPLNNWFVSSKIVNDILNKVNNKLINPKPYKFKSLKVGREETSVLVDKVNKTEATTINTTKSYQQDVNKFKVVTSYLNNGPTTSAYHNDMLHLKAVQVVNKGIGIQGKHRYIACDTKSKANHLRNYLSSNFCNIIWAYTRTSRTLDNPQVRYIPQMDLSKDWDDKSIAKFFKLNNEEQKYINEFYVK